LPTPTIGATAATQANKFFAPVTYTGLGATQDVTVGFQPDFVWIKNRTLGANWHVLTDSVRGIQKEIYTNSTAAEATLTTSGVNQFSAGGFQILGNTNDYNGSTSNYVAWNWRASNATAVTNTSGSITSSVSANPTAGFSIVTYTGNNTSGATVGHGLGVVPSMVIVKGRSATSDWWVAHSGIPSAWLQLQSAAAASSGGGGNGSINYQSTFTSSVFGFIAGSISSNNVNASAGTYVAYCFAPVAGFSAFGSYTGNGSDTNGPFVHTGFRPAFLLIKSSSAATDWVIYDSKRDPVNVTDLNLRPNATDAESSQGANYIDLLSNGFKLRGDGSGSTNASAATYIYMAFAETPFKYSLAR
jgi:hypothetical protein